MHPCWINVLISLKKNTDLKIHFQNIKKTTEQTWQNTVLKMQVYIYFMESGLFIPFD